MPLTLALVDVLDGMRAGAGSQIRNSGVKRCGWFAVCAAGLLVCMALREDRVCLRQSDVSSLQRRDDVGAGAHPGSIRPSGSAPDRAHEYVCAVSADACGADVQTATRCGGA